MQIVCWLGFTLVCWFDLIVVANWYCILVVSGVLLWVCLVSLAVCELVFVVVFVILVWVICLMVAFALDLVDGC